LVHLYPISSLLPSHLPTLVHLYPISSLLPSYLPTVALSG
jgi:hypothetical protein